VTSKGVTDTLAKVGQLSSRLARNGVPFKHLLRWTYSD
jgi:hypothetical protein